jgi:hypothetical protein
VSYWLPSLTQLRQSVNVRHHARFFSNRYPVITIIRPLPHPKKTPLNQTLHLPAS